MSGSYFIADNRRPTTVTSTFAFTSSRVSVLGGVHWTVAVVRECLRQQSVTVVFVQQVATSYSAPDL